MRPHRSEGATMLWTIFVIVLVLWLLGFSFHVAGSMIHLLLVLALIILIFNLLAGHRSGF
jgi:membrane-bound ClpP family serine protease